MKNLFILKTGILLVLLTSAFFSKAQNYQPTDNGSKVHFVVRNFGINTGGDLHGLAGNIVFNPANLASSVFNVSVEVKTIDTDNDSRDEHLRSDEYFDAEKYPLITLKSTRIDKTNKTSTGWYFFTGVLTIHGVSKTISFPFTATPKGADYLLSSKFDINRVDYHVGKTSSVMSSAVKVSLSVLAKKS